MKDLRIQKLASQLINYSVKLKENEKILIGYTKENREKSKEIVKESK